MIMQRLRSDGPACDRHTTRAPIGQTGEVPHEDSPTLGTKGSLLVAVPLLEEPTFHRTVIYMLQHTDEGALGLVINRPTTQEHVPGLDPWMHELSYPPVVFSGGPVQDNTLIALAALALDVEAEGFSSLGNGLGTVDLSLLPDELAEGLQQLRVFRGYSGWGPGQLDNELDEGSWIVLAGGAADVFSTEPEGLWRAVLRRAGGRIALLADAPGELGWN
ncbi:unannotated protein [freshwater metagenome]|uniref:Unannotated protein n=1 Tax=freshwater metagenome TaxID=449393 RepID=A0A6J7F1J8_9ZZZZ|nr:hypothetical protein [Actinomycetota bacterium]